VTAPGARRKKPVLTIALAVIVTGVSVYLLARGWSFYKLSEADRPEHPDFRTLRSYGSLGNGYGWIAAVLMLINLSYLLRRRFAGLKVGSMAIWLEIHVFTGLMIASLVSFHSTFELKTPAAILGTVSLVVVVITGVAGRLLHMLAPRGTKERLVQLIDRIEAEFPDMREDLANAIAKRPGPQVPANAPLTRAIAAIPAWRRAARERTIALRFLIPRKESMTPTLRRSWRTLIRVAAADARASGVDALLRSWRGLHRFFALLMIVAVLVHAGIAWQAGYHWIFTS
jgi:hypothetical protein